ncbi:CRISPR-associated Csx14 family protein [Thermodesulfitimonas autotrophica]|uniref:CRISPR-associated Csx14 family protein n=1 Tax=Thermodesulfitimonas autotrophica TaxID=1894989 RepID=A0A3N5BMP6_9THEO|nr:CRISPR-associated ring nuclease [Thermodesulfitimonas autotrophica]RPF47005.1 CRISPR-associated Csx14 family protein [Thermodesulfitimonas autotrophica]
MRMGNAARNDGTEALVATLGVEPQVVTITLDALLKQGRGVREVTVVYTEAPGVAQALAAIAGEFSGGTYPGITLRQTPVVSPKGPVADFRTEEDLRGLLCTLYGVVRRARQRGSIVHLCISGGRKVMGIMGMVVAQLLFGPEDHVWHLLTEGWHPGVERRLHLPPEEKVWLVPVPVLRWGEAGTLMRTVAELDDPAEVVAWYERLNRNARTKRQEEFIRRWLSRAEREVVQLACRGLDNGAIARALSKSEQTVANQLRSVYEKLREWLGHPPHNVDRNVLIAEFAPYFSLTEAER